ARSVFWPSDWLASRYTSAAVVSPSRKSAYNIDFRACRDRSGQVAYLLLSEKNIDVWSNLALLVDHPERQTWETAVESRDGFPQGGSLDFYHLEAPSVGV